VSIEPADEPLEHVLRAAPPWRDGAVLTECGRLPGPETPVLSLEDFVRKVKALGKTRTSMTTCITCWTTAARWQASRWETDPVGVMVREIDRARTVVPGQVRDNPAARLFRDELVALAELAARHHEEFAGLVAGVQAAPRLAEARQKRRRAAS
jgi:hypothetical protein